MLCFAWQKGWGKKHAAANYVFVHNPSFLVVYHNIVMSEMLMRGYRVNEQWNNDDFRGNDLGIQNGWASSSLVSKLCNDSIFDSINIYPEHNDKYLLECLENLKSKGIVIDFNK